MAGQGPRPVPPEEIERRQEYLEPLWEYLRAYCYSRINVTDAARLRAREAGEYVSRDRRRWSWKLANMRRGESLTPPWFVATCCAVMGKSVAEVMGAQWVERFGADGRGGTERAPVGQPRVQRGWRHSKSSESTASTESAGTAA